MASTLTEIGQQVGCSPSTVSRVLNNSGPVSAALRHRVENAVKQHGLVSRLNTRSLKLRKPQCDNALVLVYRPGPLEVLSKSAEGLQVSPPQEVEKRNVLSSNYELTDGFYRSVLDGLLEETHHWDVEIRVEMSSKLSDIAWASDPSKNAPPSKNASTKVLFVGPYRQEVADFAQRFKDPLVLVGINLACRHDAVTIDNFGGIRQAVKHLVELGHRDIGFVGVEGLPDFEERRLAFLASMFEHDLPIRREWINLGSEQMAEITKRTSTMLTRSERPTALVCGNDLSAMSTIQAADRCGIRVPQELSVVGFDDIPVATLTSPALTTVHVPMQQIGRQALQQMLICDTHSYDENRRGSLIRVATDLVVRQSTAPVAVKV